MDVKRCRYCWDVIWSPHARTVYCPRHQKPQNRRRGVWKGKRLPVLLTVEEYV